jgi:hypothetical protein
VTTSRVVRDVTGHDTLRLDAHQDVVGIAQRGPEPLVPSAPLLSEVADEEAGRAPGIERLDARATTDSDVLDEPSPTVEVDDPDSTARLALEPGGE